MVSEKSSASIFGETGYDYFTEHSSITCSLPETIPREMTLCAPPAVLTSLLLHLCLHFHLSTVQHRPSPSPQGRFICPHQTSLTWAFQHRFFCPVLLYSGLLEATHMSQTLRSIAISSPFFFSSAQSF